MCGIVGIALRAHNGLIKKTEDVFFDMLFVDTLRGEDSTGIIYVENDSSFGIIKEGLSAPDCIYDIRYDPDLKGMWSKGKAYIGHNRKKTIGEVSDETAHPFVIDDKFAMVHNGTLYGHKLLHDTEVDSEALAIVLSKHLNKDFNKESFEEAMGTVNGAYAIAAYNQETDKIYLTRNKERPLFMVETAEGWLWASEGAMITWICGRNNINMSGNTPQLIKENTLVSIDLKTNSVSVEEYQPKKAQVTPQVIGAVTKQSCLGTPAGTKLSKNQYKRLSKKFLGKMICFYVEDFVEKNFPKSIADGETIVNLLGDCQDITYNHMIQAEFDISELPVGDREVIDCYYYGTVYSMEYDKIGGLLLISLINLKKAVPSLPLLTHHETPTIVH